MSDNVSFSTNPEIVKENTPFTLTWTDTNFTFLANKDYGLLLNEIPRSISIGSNSNNITFFVNGKIEGNYTVKVVDLENPENYNVTHFNNKRVACLVEGTEILCINNLGRELYLKIENIKIGTKIKTYFHGAKKLIKIMKKEFKNDKGFNQICKLSNIYGQTNDLFLTGGYSTIVKKLTDYQREQSKDYDTFDKKIDNLELLISHFNSKCEKIDDDKIYNVYYIVLQNEDVDGQYGIYANGVLVETTSINTFNETTCSLKIVSSDANV
jgi:hypothetical protein